MTTTRAIWITGTLFILLTLFLGSLSFAGGGGDGGEGVKEKIEDRIAHELLKSLPWDPGDVEVTGIEVSGLDERKDAFDDLIVGIPKGMKNPGKITFSVILVKSGKETKKFWASARIRVFAKAVVALNAVRKNSAVKEGDVKVARVDVNEAVNAASSLEEAVGNIASRPIAAGSVVKKDYLRPPALVRKGESVTLMAENDSIKVRSKGVATEDGIKGGFIKIKVSSGRVLAGRVTGPGELTVGF